MEKKTKIRIQKIAADILVAPLTAVASGKEILKKYNESENGRKTKENLKKTGYRISETVRKVSENIRKDDAVDGSADSGKKKRETVKDIAGKIGGVFTEGVGKVGEFFSDVDQRAEERMKTDASSTADGKHDDNADDSNNTAE
ncbi:MAG: hypothetical protein HUJ76_02770 [Parasporobacterium sp.]|nr:hypothetical protein [Parasporobacterium sp.]